MWCNYTKKIILCIQFLSDCLAQLDIAAPAIKWFLLSKWWWEPEQMSIIWNVLRANNVITGNITNPIKTSKLRLNVSRALEKGKEKIECSNVFIAWIRICFSSRDTSLFETCASFELRLVVYKCKAAQMN